MIEYPLENAEPFEINNGVEFIPERVGTYAISMDSNYIDHPLAPVLVHQFPTLLNWSDENTPNPLGIHYPNHRNISEPLLRSAINGRIIEMPTVDLAISRNALRKLFSCFMPYDNRRNGNFVLTVEQVSETLTVIRECIDDDNNRPNRAGFALDFEEQMTIPETHSFPFSLYYEAMSYNIGNYKVLVGCEIDAVNDEGRSVELKTSRIRDYDHDWNENDQRNFYRHAWLQMKLSGTDTFCLGNVRYPRKLFHGAEASVNVNHDSIMEVRRLGNLTDYDETLLFARVAKLLGWIKENLPFNLERRIATLRYTARENIANWRVGRGDRHRRASLTLTVQPFHQDQSTISEDFFNNTLLPSLRNQL